LKMILRFGVIIGLTLILVSAAIGAEWEMIIHKGQDAEVHVVADIDSVTFAFAHPVSMILVQSGTFIMGDSGVTYCADEHEVTLTRDYYLGKHEVTNQEYLETVQWAYDQGYVTTTTSSVRDNLDGSTQELIDLDGLSCEIQFDGVGSFYLRESPSSYAQDAFPAGYDPVDHPVKEVTWYGAVRYCDWLSLQEDLPRAYEHSGNWTCNNGDPYGAVGYRLPTDAEWEYAAQWDDERIYPWGDEDPDCSRANYKPGPGYSCVGWTSSVGSYPSAPEALNLSDMAANMYEWCNDYHTCSLGTTSTIDPTGPDSGIERLCRGGSWFDQYTYYLACAARSYDNPHGSSRNRGFRIARTAE
jgi:formylglycine-generating enzyme required for sulfatase activity